MNDDEPVGSLSEELAKLIGVVSGLTDSTAAASGPPDAESESESESEHDPPEHDPPEHEHHIANGSAACQVCPVCQTIAFVRSTSPEVREHLAASAASFAAAARGLVDAVAAQQRNNGGTTADAQPGGRSSGVENIDLSEDDAWD